MALLTMQSIARRALATLYNNTVAAQLVFRDFDQDFTGKVGDTVSVRTPAVFEAKVFDRTAGIELQDPSEGSTNVVLDTLLDVSFPVTTEALSLQLDNFAERLLSPAMEALVQGIDGILLEALVDAANSGSGGGVADGTSVPNHAYLTARTKLGRAKLPQTQRYAILSPEGASQVLTDPLLVKANESGSTDALRNANIGRVFGFDNYEAQGLGSGSGDAGSADGVAFHRDAVALVSRTLEKPMGAAAENVAVESYKGFGLRVVKDYDIDKKQDVISVDVLIGKKVLRPAGAVELDFGQGS